MAREKVFYNALTNILQSDYRALSRLREKYNNWEEAWNNFERKDDVDPDVLFEKLEQNDIRLILSEDDDFPALLREIPLPPHAIYLQGNLPVQDKTSIAIVGTRKTTPDGEDLAFEFGKALAGKGLNIVSGLALGVDSASHKGAIKTGLTFAVLATGVDNPYPKTNARLAEEIIETGGGLISEYPPGNTPFPYRFLERNRIVSGMCKATIVIEAPQNSGSLVTSRFALDQNREVFVVPGPAGHVNYRGSHGLIRLGARLVSTPAEVLEDLGLEDARASELGENSTESDILSIIASQGPLQFDEIVELTKLETAHVNQSINYLQIIEKIRETAKGYEINS